MHYLVQTLLLFSFVCVCVYVFFFYHMTVKLFSEITRVINII